MSFTYKGLQAQFTRHVVTEEEVQMQLLNMQRQAPRYTEVTDRVSQLGDEVILDYAGFCDGEQFAGGTAENQNLVLGSGTFIPGFEEQLVGKAVGEEVSVQVTFPQQYHSEALAGKAAEFKCKIHQIRVKSSYELDDTFAKEIGGCDTLEQMRQKLAESMQAYADEKEEMTLQDTLLRMASETLEMEPSEAQIEAEVDNHIQNLSAHLAQQGLSLELYFSFTGSNEKELRENARAEARNAVRMQATIEKIVELENLEITEQEQEKALQVVAQENGLTLEMIRPYCDEDFMAALRKSVLTGKVMHLIRENAILL